MANYGIKPDNGSSQVLYFMQIEVIIGMEM